MPKQILILTIFLVGCSNAPYPDMTDTLVGGVSGAAIGAGTGALIGNVISNGNVAKSALVGGAIGVAAGATIGALYQSAKDQGTVMINNSQIRSNDRAIKSGYQEIQETRQELLSDVSGMDVSPSSGEYRYTGQKLGGYNR